MRDIKEIEKRYKDPNRIPGRGSHLFKKRYLLFIILLIAFITNPDEEKHREAVKHKINSIVLPPDPSGSGYVGSHPSVDPLVNNHITVNNYFLFSTTRAFWNNEEATIGLGIFGYVFISDMVDKAINKRLNN